MTVAVGVTAKYVVSDLNGSNQVAIDPANSWAVTRRYLDPYGNALKPSTGTAGVLPGSRSFLNKSLNPTTSLVDMGARQYDPLTGQFLSVDPIVDGTSAQQAQGYTYANNNPVMFADPSGLWFGSVVKAVSSAARAVAKTVATVVKSTYTAVKRAATAVSRPVVDLVQSAARSYSTSVRATYQSTTSSVSSSWNAATSGATQMVARAKTVIKKVDVVGSALKTVAVGAYNFAIGDMIRACSQGISLSCGAEIAMMTPWGKFAKAGKLAFKVAGKMDDAIGATRSLARQCSFTGETRVLMADGSRKPIEDIKVGDLVMASDPQTDEQGPRRVEAVHVHKDTVTDIEVDGEVVTTTEDHPFWSVDDQTFERADELSAGERVLGADGQPRVVSAAVGASAARRALAYNLSIQRIHTYHVGAGDVLVHNTCGAADAAGLEARANAVHGALDPIARNSRTTAALSTREGRPFCRALGETRVLRSELWLRTARYWLGLLVLMPRSLP